MPITMTQAAEDHVLRSLQNRKKGIGVRLGVKTTGCSGLSYVLEFVDAAALDDEVFEFDSFKVLVDSKSMIYLDGTELDFVKADFTEGFEFRNPNVKDECGCGESFHV